MAEEMFNAEQVAHMEAMRRLPLDQVCWCGWRTATECPKTDSHCQGALAERLKEAQRYRFLADSAEIRDPDCGGAFVSFENWIPVTREIGAHRWKINKAVDEWMAAEIAKTNTASTRGADTDKANG